MELLGFCIAIFLIAIFLLYPYAMRRLASKMWDLVLSKRRQRGLETESLQKLKDSQNVLAYIAEKVEGGKERKNRKLTRIVTTHLFLYLGVFLFINCCFLYGGNWLWDRQCVSPTTRNIILLIMVVVVFPLVSVAYEIERRKLVRKRRDDISRHGSGENH